MFKCLCSGQHLLEWASRRQAGFTVVAHPPLLTGLAVSEHLQEQRAGICLLLSFLSPANAWGGP